eukprot:CAMPEP_0168628120 /NCGR_PEP_ID=MMETSP0449_2-20121227/11669_1 /TAXON_ID=1082188 /ORGANISM="Strombidium rassoulzadegani, Strain ras09" /LENGTH=73 /DNA_ID=CAMNT_0008670507 /DNA_START=290 /DNA_END=511 /DNA_ORIENTATION=+
MTENVGTSTGVGASSNRAVANGVDVILLEELDQLVLNVQRMELDLIHGGLDSAVAHHVPQNLHVEVGHANAFD